MRGLIKNWDVIKQINTDNYDVLLFNEIWQVKSHEQLQLQGFKLANPTYKWETKRTENTETRRWTKNTRVKAYLEVGKKQTTTWYKKSNQWKRKSNSEEQTVLTATYMETG